MNLPDRLAEIVRRRNREIAFDAVLKASLGVAFSFVTFGMILWFASVLGDFFGPRLNLHAWQFGAIVTGLFFVVATWSAWRRVDPMAGLTALSDRQLMLTMISQASGDLLYFSPRHASAGFALLLIGGPAGVIEAFAIWVHRIRADDPLLEEAARLLASCDPELPTNQVRKLHAAFLLRRLALVKVVPHEDSRALTLTDKGFAALSKGTSKAKRKRGDETGGERHSTENP